MMRPPCTVCGKEGLQHYKTLDGFTNVWFCTFECEVEWQQHVAPAARIADRRRMLFTSADSDHGGFCKLAARTDERIADAVLGHAVLTKEELAQIEGVVMSKSKCAVCEKRTNNPQAFFCSAACAQVATNALKAIRLLQPVADRACRFLAGLNLQDHSIKEQREQVEITNQLVSTLRPKRGKL